MKNLQSRTKVRLLQSFLLISLSLFSFVSPTYAQGGFTVKGVVVDKTGFPLPGANVMEKGTSNGAITDLDGNFSLTVSKKGVTLTVSFMGYTAKDVVVKDKTMNITLEENSKLLDEVVVVGYGTMKKRDVTGAITSISSEAIEQKMATNVFEALQGTTAGVQVVSGSGQPGESSSIKIRGTSTFSAEGVTPLYIVDGVPLESIDGINTNDITSMEILKDAASAAIYGSRSANGVIIITTKSGQEGKARIDIKYNHSWGTLSHKVPQANRAERLLYDQYRKEYFETYGGGNANESIDILDDPLNSFFNVDNDYLDMITTTAQKDQVDISVGGGTKKLKYFINTGYYNEKGIISNTGFQRLNTRINSDYSPTDWMNMGSRISLTYSKKKGLNEGTLLSAVLTRRPYFNTYYPDGSLVGVFNGQKNPIAQVNYTTDFTDSYKANFFQFFEIKFNKYLKFRANINANFYLDKRKKLEPSLITDEWQKQNKGYSYNYLNWNWMNEDILTYARKIKDHNFTAMVGVSAQQWRYENETFVGINSSTDFIYTMNAFAANLDLSSTGSTLSNHSMASVFARVTYDYKGRYLLNAIMRRDGSSRFAKGHRWGFFPSFSAGYDIARTPYFQQLALPVSQLKVRVSYGRLGNQNGAGLYDYIAQMPLDAQGTNAWLLPGISSSTASKGTIAKTPKMISPYITWEKVDNANLGFDLMLLKNRLSITADFYQRTTRDMIGPAESIPSISGIASDDRAKVNNATLRNRGWELSVSWNDKLKCGFSYGIGFNVFNYKAVVTKYNNPEGIIYNNHTGLAANKGYYEGMDIGEIWGYRADDLFLSNREIDDYLRNVNLTAFKSNDLWRRGDLKYIDSNGDGRVDGGKGTLADHGDLQIIGNTTPKYSFGINLNLGYKGFEISTLLQGVAKRDFPISGSNYMFGGNNYNFKEHLDYFSTENPNGYLPRLTGWKDDKDFLVNTGYNTTRYLLNAAYMRMKNLTVGYTFNKKQLRHIGISNLKVYVTCDNLFTVTKLPKQFDPETLNQVNMSAGGDAQNTAPGLTSPMKQNGNGMVYPMNRNFVFGLDFTF